LAQIGHLATNFKASGLRPGDRFGLSMIDNIDVVLRHQDVEHGKRR
jgi:acyl-CoA synthetase (AMP-forming)/AMP-acid ligase II